MRLRGLEEQHELSPQLLLRDTRTLGMKIVDFFKDPVNSACLMVCFALMTFFFPAICDVIGLVAILVFIYAYTQRSTLPFRMPLRSNTLDYNDTLPGSTKPRKARGISFFGNHRVTNDELWFNNDDMRTHVLIFGSTGSGKTVALTSLAYNALIQGSGFLYVDGKGDNSLFAAIFSMCRTMGREDDLLLINFMTGARDIVGAQEKRLSNTMNPFCNGSSSMLSQLVVSMMDQGTQSADGDMWKGRAIVFVEALMKVLVYMRDKGKILLDANSIRNYFELPRLEAIGIDKMFPRDNQEPVSLADAPDLVLEPIKNYLKNLPGYDPSKKGKQSAQVLEQHGFITMQLTRVFGSLADTYGHIIRTNLAEVDLKDVVLNRRILIVLLPALEKSPDELANLGKVIIASLRAMMAAGLGESVEGSYREVIERNATSARTPYMCILDEYGYYAVKGFAVVPAQARSLGFSVIFAGQDLPAFQKASKEEAASIGANTNIKICMKLEDPTETWDFFMKSAGESYVTHVDSFQVDIGSVFGMYQDGRGARAEKRARIDLLDLKEQAPGEAHFFFKSKIVRGKFFFANPKMTKEIRLNHFLKVDTPSDDVIQRLKKGFTHIEKMKSKNLVVDRIEDSNEEVRELSALLEKQAESVSLLDKASIALREYYFQNEIPMFFDDVEEETLVLDHTHLFMPLRETSHLEEIVIAKDQEAFKKPILNRAELRDQVEYLQRLCGKNGQEAMNIAIEVIGDMEKGTQYPPPIKPMKNSTEISRVIRQMVEDISLKKMTASGD